MRQRSVRRTVTLDGVGLHTGSPVRVRIGAAPPDTGIVFHRIDQPAAREVRASIRSVVDTTRGITVGPEADPTSSETVATVEHLLSAAAGLGIDNLRVEVEGPEMPALDGSALEYVRSLEAAGIEEQDAAARIIQLSAVTVEQNGSRASSEPGEGFAVAYVVDLPAPLGRQTFEWGRAWASPCSSDYATGVAPARTWGFLHDAEPLRARGLARGASTANVLVIGDEGYLNVPRFADEPARHKVLDLLGDLALLGARLRGKVLVERGGHALHVALARAIRPRVEDGPVQTGGGGEGAEAPG